MAQLTVLKLTFALIAAAAAVAAAGLADGAEIRLRKESFPSGNLVLLGDLADIFAGDPEEVANLKAVELLPVPAAGQRRFVRAREIQDLLHARGVNLAAHRFSGARQVSLGAGIAPVSTARVVPMSAIQTKQAHERVRLAIQGHLRSQSGNDELQYEIEVKLSPVQTRALSKTRSRVSATGGTAPWLGSQQFDLRFQTKSGETGFNVEAQIRHPDAIVVAVRALRRGAIVRASDVSLQRGAAVGLVGHRIETFQTIDEVVGLETTRAITAGQPFAAQLLRPRLMVRRGDVVTVYARSAGVEVRTFARARDDGSLGDFVSLQRLTKGRQELRARVTGEREVDVLAQSTTVAPVDKRP